MIVAYILQTQLEALLPPTRIVEALDDNGDGEQDPGLWENVEESVRKKIDDILGQRFAVPFATPPAAVVSAALVLAADRLFRRRAIVDELNPWAKEAKDTLARLMRMATGQEPLDATLVARNAPIATIEEDSRLFSLTGSAMI